MYRSLVAEAQVFYRKIDVVDAQGLSGSTHVGNRTLAQHKAFQLNGQSGWLRNGLARRCGLVGGGSVCFCSICFGCARFGRIGLGRSGLWSISFWRFGCGFCRSWGFALADFDNGTVEANFAHNHITGKQGAQFQLGHAALDGNGHALGIIRIAPVRLSKVDAGWEKGNSWRRVEL